jgi:hypothetical protein
MKKTKNKKGGARQTEVKPLGAAALFVPSTKEGSWTGAGASPAAPMAIPITAALSTVPLSAASLSATAFSMASSAALLSVATLSVATTITAASSGAVGAGPLPLGPPAPECRHSHLCRGSSSSDDTSSSSRMTHACLPLPGARAGSEPPAGQPPQPPAEMPPRRLSGRHLPGCHHGYLLGRRPDHDHQRR